MTGVTTYPFRIFKWETFGYKDLPVKDTIVGHDAWIGHNTVIMPGVQIGAGAIIADLLDLAWWDWPIDKIEANLRALETGDIEALKIT